MNRLILASGMNEAYEERALPYLESLRSEANVECLIFTVGYEAGQDLKRKLPDIEFRQVENSAIQSMNPNSCLQHGGFLHAIEDVDAEDTIIYTDADIILQRPFHAEEIQQFRSLGPGEVMAGYNKSPDQTLEQEATALGLRCEPQELRKAYEGIEKMITFNTGVIICQVGTYRNLYARYNEKWPTLSPLFTHYAKQQWLLSYLIQKHFEPLILSGCIHTHGHYPIDLRLPAGSFGQIFCIDHKPVALRHAINNPAYHASRSKITDLKRRLHASRSEITDLKRRLHERKKLMRLWCAAFILACITAALAIALK